MDFNIYDDSVSPTMNVFLVIANILNFVYNIPQMVKTYKTKSTKDFSSSYLFLRVIGNSIWVVYSIELNTFMFFMANSVTLISSIFISYYKILELYKDRYNKINFIDLNDDCKILIADGIGTNEIGTNEICTNEIGTDEIIDLN
jgi:MtN3 and saliva related transmembrane protein